MNVAIAIPYSANRQALPFHSSTARDRLLIGGLGSGKTTAGAAEHFRIVCRCGPDVLHLVGAPSNKVLRLNTFPAVKALLLSVERESGWRPAKKIWDTDQNRQILWWNGASSIFLTVKDPDTIMGYNTASNWLDEAALIPDSQGALQACMNRRRDPRAAEYHGIYTTSPRGPVGIVNTFERETAADNPDFFVTTITSFSNHRNLPPQYIPDMMRGMSTRQVDQDIFGKVVRIEGSVYSVEYDPTPYPKGSLIMTWKKGRPRRPEYYVTIDWGPNHPHVLFIERDPDLDLDVVFDELVEEGLDHRALCLRAVRRLADWGLTVSDIGQWWCDPNPAEATTELKSVIKNGRVHRKWGQDINRGIDRVRGRLLEHTGRRRLAFAARLVNHTKHERRITQCMLLYKWTQKHTDEGVVRLDQAQKGKFDHGADALRYFVVGRYPTANATEPELSA